jgi:hypothetical protein
MSLKSIKNVLAAGALAASVNACGDDVDVVTECGNPVDGKNDVVLKNIDEIRSHCHDYIKGGTKLAAVRCDQKAPNAGKTDVPCTEIAEISNGQFDNKYGVCTGNSSDVCKQYIHTEENF